MTTEKKKETLKLPDWTKLNFHKQDILEFTGIRTRAWSTDLTEIGAEDWCRKISIGIDPGKNYGIAVITDVQVDVYNGEMPDAEHQDYGVMAYNLIREICDYHCLTHGDVSVVEGASYGSTYGQVGLAEIRFGFYLGLLHSSLLPKIVPPATVRKSVFGGGKVQAGDIWPSINHNGADALGIALYGQISQ